MLIKLNSNPTKLTYEFKLKTSESVDYEFKSNGQKTKWDKLPKLHLAKGQPMVLKKNDVSRRGISFKKLQIWDSSLNKKIEDITSEFTPTGNSNEFSLQQPA